MVEERDSQREGFVDLEPVMNTIRLFTDYDGFYEQVKRKWISDGTSERDLRVSYINARFIDFAKFPAYMALGLWCAHQIVP